MSFISLKELIPQYLRSRKAQTLVEYAIILAFIAIVTVVVLQAIGTSVKSKYSTVTSGLDNAP